MSETLVHDLVKARLKCDALSQQLKEAEAERDGLSKLIAEQWGASAVKSQKVIVDGRPWTVYRKRKLLVSVLAHNRGSLVEGCRALGLNHLIVTDVPTTKLKPWIIEQVSDDDRGEDGEFDLQALPDEIRDFVRLHEDVEALVRKG